ncbi:uroporphyrinogen-III synthase [Brevundimonas sp.]|uniref:uroporphyrinogen-III synthase n=1 Tax=Brevundimonas sp. TaxID=1871086 RepID=UPI00391D048F
MDRSAHAPLRLWVTRARPGAEATAARLTAMGHHPLVSPLLSVRRLKPRIDLSGVGAIAFTSRNGVAAFAALERALPVFTVGDATAGAAREAGFRHVRSASGDVTALAALITAQPVDGAVLIAGAREPAGDLPGALKAAGVQTRTAVLYAAVAAPGGRGLAALKAGKLDGVLIHSPRAARRLADLTEGLIPPVGAVPVFCISPAAAAPLKGSPAFAAAAADHPDEAALLSLLGKPRPPV